LNSDRKYLTQLTWLRGIAASLVVVSHSLRTAEGQYSSSSPNHETGFLNLLDLGTFGVMLFFVLSGATLYFSNGQLSLKKETIPFYIKRIFRIWPAFVVSLLAYITFMPLFTMSYGALNGNWIEKQFFSTWDMDTLLSYITLSFNITGPSGIFNNAYWSLPVEFQYYLMFPALIFSMRLFGVAGPFGIAIVCYCIQKFELVNFHSNQVFFLAYTFCFGVIAGYLHEKYRFRIPKNLAFLVLLTSTLTCSFAQLGVINFGNLPIISNPYGSAGIFAIISVVAVLFIDRGLNSESVWIRCPYWLGEVSYSLYLYHNLVLGALVILFIQMSMPQLINNTWLILALTLLITSLIASFSYQWIEKEGSKLGKYIVKKWYYE
jgi:peptidoglycan/LPS O-acetylase OafA/YrhL